MSDKLTIHFTIKSNEISEDMMIEFSSLVEHYVCEKNNIALYACTKFLKYCGCDTPYLYDLCEITDNCNGYHEYDEWVEIENMRVACKMPGFLTRREMVACLVQYIDISLTAVTEWDLDERDKRLELGCAKVWAKIAKIFGGVF